jgi:hypothetical protein
MFGVHEETKAMRSRRFLTPANVLRLSVAVLGCLALVGPARGDAFDHYTNPVITRLLESKNVKEVKQLEPGTLTENDAVLPGIESAFVVVRTNTGRQAKLLLQAGKQKISEERSLPILIIDRFVTYKEGEERTILASGKNQSLFPGFRFSLDLGMVVPEEVGGDIQLVVEKDKIFTKPIGKARLFLVKKALPEATPKKGPALVIGDKFEPKYFNGSYKLHDDGRRSGTLTLKVDEDGDVTGAYYSDKDGQKYEVVGKIGMPAHSIEFRIKFPRTEQSFKGMLFTGDGKAMAGTSRLLERETAFYAIRSE